MELDLSGESVLIVDDEKFSRSIVAHLLQEMGKPQVFHANNGAKALEVLDAERGKMSFIISDFNMPVMHGLQLLKAIRGGHREIERAMPVAMVTGYSEKHLVDQALALDVNAFLIKPVSKEALEKRLTKMLNVVHSDIWLKADDAYSDVAVDFALDEIAGRQSARDGESRRFYIKGEEEALLRDPKLVGGGSPAGARAEKAARPEPAPKKPAPGKPLQGYQCPVDDIPAGAVLAKDVHTADGRLFMHAGARLTPRVIAILHDLQALDHPVDSIWIAK